MTTYRKPFQPPVDRTAEALADLGQTMRRVRVRFLVPGIVLSFLAAAAGSVAHGAGHLAFVRAADGSYLVNKATFLVYAALAASAVAVPSWILFLLTSAAVRARWIAKAPSRFDISDEEAADCAAMFR